MSEAGLMRGPRASLAGTRVAVIAVRACDRVDVVRRRLSALALAHHAEGPEALNGTDTRLVVGGPEFELTAWRCALAIREQLLGEARLRIVCHLAERDRARGELLAPVRTLLERADWNFVLALAPFGDALAREDVDDAETWRLRCLHGHSALVFPASDIGLGKGDGAESIFEAKAPPRLGRFVIRLRERQSAEIGRWLDADGFLDASKIEDRRVLPALDVLRSRWSLVVAPPWTGKTHVAKHVQDTLGVAGGPLVQLTNLESLDEDLKSVPLEWHKWRSSQDKLVWLIDAVDEALHRGGALAELKAHLHALNNNERLRLQLVLFTRDDDTKQRVVDYFARELQQTLDVFQLLPIDRLEAARFLARGEESGEVRLERALSRLAAANLESWSTHLRILERAADAPEDARGDALVELLLEQLCTESAARNTKFDVTFREQLRIAARVAAVMLLAKVPVLAEDGTAQPGTGQLLDSEADIKAFRALTQRGPLLALTGDGYRFRQEHAKELLAAYGLKDLRLGVLRRLVTTKDGCLRPDLTEVVEQLIQFRRKDHPELRAWQRMEPLAWNPDEAIAKLERVEELAPLSWPGLYIRSDRRLNHPKIREHLLGRVRDEEVPAEARSVFLEVAERNRWEEFAPLAVEIALDEAVTWDLRRRAVDLLVAVGDSSHRARLRPLLRETSNESENLRAQVLCWMVREDEDPLEVAKRMPLPSDAASDYRSFLQSLVEERLTIEHARVIVDAARGAASELSPEIARLFVEWSLRMLVQYTEPTSADRARIVSCLFPQRDDFGEILSLLTGRLAREPALRRDFYLQFQQDRKFYPAFHLRPEDAEWLLKSLASGEVPAASVGELIALASAVDQGLQERIEAYVRDHHPHEWATWQQRRVEQAAVEAELRAAWASLERQHPRSPPVWLGDLVAEAISSQDQPTRRLHELSYLCFQRRPPRRVDGTFSGLPTELKTRTIEHVKKLLGQGEPTALPNQPGGYSSAIRLEGEAFSAAIGWEDPETWVTEELIRRWLPAALFAAEAELFETVRRCAALSPDATAESVVMALESEAKSRDFPSFAHLLPSSVWMYEDVLRASHALIERSDVSLEYRALLLRASAEHAWMRTRGLVNRLVRSEEMRLRAAAVSCLVLGDPERATEHLDVSWSDEVLAQVLKPISIWTHGSQERFAKWSDRAVVKLLLWLAPRELPPDSRRFAFVGPGDHLREIRARLESRLDRMTKYPEYDEIVRKLEPLNAAMAENRRRAKATYEVLDLFSEPAARPLSIHEVIDALDGVRSLRFRDENDLADALLDCLKLIGETSKNDLPDLVRPGEPADERVLQVYVFRRLWDLIPQLERSKYPFLAREPREGREEPDVWVAAEGEGGRPIAVPIEVKWSHSSTVMSDLTTQLGTRYLLRSRRPRGIYLVGWSGRGRETDPGNLDARLRELALSFRQSHPQISIDVCVLDTCLSSAKEQMRPRRQAKSPSARHTGLEEGPARRGKRASKKSPKDAPAAKARGTRSNGKRVNAPTVKASARVGREGAGKRRR